MSARLILLLGPSPADPVEWGVIDGDHVETGAATGAAALAALAARKPSRTVALLPGEQAAARVLPSAPAGAARLEAAARLLIEDELAEPIDTLAFAAVRDGERAIACAARKEIVEAWAEAFGAAGLSIDSLYPDYLALPDGALVMVGERALRGGTGGFALERSLFDSFAESLAPEGENIRTVAKDAPGLRALFLLLAQGDAAFAAPDLFRGARRHNADWRAALRPWRRAGALAAATLGAAAVVLAVDASVDGRSARRLQNEARAVHAAAFPEAAASDPAGHARRIIAAGAAGRGFLDISARIRAAAQDGAVQIDRIVWDEKRGETIVSVRSETDAEIEAMKSRLIAAGVPARDNGGYRRAGAAWVGELAARTP